MAVLHAVDYAIWPILLVVMSGMPRITYRRPDADELFLAGRSLGWAVVGLSLFASNISR